MKLNVVGLVLCAALMGCGGGDAPFGEPDTGTDGGSGTGGDPGDPGGIVREGLPPGTSSPTASSRIVRSEPTQAEGGEEGDGFATGVRYDGAEDVFTVDGLAFDGGNRYARGVNVASLSDEFAVYEAFQQFPDALNGDPINQFTHRAIYGVSRNLDGSGNPETQFAIIRTGAYVGYGFGGFIYEREGSVDLPENGQAIFRGKTAGLRDFNGQGGLQYSTSNIVIAMDFEDFNPQTTSRGDGVRGVLSDRRVFDIDGNDITDGVLQRINATSDASLTRIPDARFVVSNAAVDGNGEVLGAIESNYVDNQGQVQVYEEGNYYAIISGDDPNEIVGVVVMENDDEFENVTVRDTSGFIVYRAAPTTP